MIHEFVKKVKVRLSGRIAGRFVHFFCRKKKKQSEREKWEEGSEDTRKGEV